MSDFIAEIKSILTEYGLNASDLSVALAVELFQDLRSYPKSYDDAKKLADMENNKNKIAMAAAEIDAKEGIEGQTAHSENGINRSYGDSSTPKAYATVVQFATVI